MSKITQKLNQEGANLRNWSTGAAASIVLSVSCIPSFISFHQVESTIAVDSSFPRLTWLTRSEIPPRLIRICTRLARSPRSPLSVDGVFGTIRVGERNEGCDATVLAPHFRCSLHPTPRVNIDIRPSPPATMSQNKLNFRVPDIKFRVLIVGRANAGKTSILQRVCETTESPKIYRVTNGTREEFRNYHYPVRSISELMV